MRTQPALLATLVASLAVPAAAQTTPATVPSAKSAVTPPADDGEEIVVTGQRERGAVAGDIPPEIQIRPAEIRALGASNIAEVLAAIAPQTGSARGRGSGAPVVLLSGRRISSFAEIRDLPSEAIARIDILPEEVALKYGYRADQRVVNIVLRERFRAKTFEVEDGFATDGDRPRTQFEGGYLQLGNTGRLSLNGEYEHLTPLFESERDIARSPASVVDLRPFRNLLPDSDRIAVNGTLNRTIFQTVAATLNARAEDTATISGFGATPALTPLMRNANTLTSHIGVALNGDLLPWRWSFTTNADRARSRSFTDNSATPGARDAARSVDRSLASDLLATGPLFKLPAGNVTTALKAGFEFRGFESDALRGGVASGARLTRDTAQVRANLDIPVASRRKGVLAPLGDLSFNLNIARDRLSDFGTLATFGYGLNWSPIAPLELIASVTREDGAPTVQQLGNPYIVTPGVRVFDLTRGETVDIARIDSGNRALTADNRRVFKLGATLRPLHDIDLTVRADYTSERVRNAIAAFPTLTPAIEAAFPDRVQRTNGRLLSIDFRPVNFAETANDQLRWGLNLSKAIGKAPPPPSPEVIAKLRQQFGNRRPGGGDGGQRAPGAGGGPRGGGGAGGGGRGGFGDFLRPRLQVGLFHTWHFKDTVRIRDGVPVLDLLNGAATGGRGGQPRHEVEFQLGLSKSGVGARLTGNWSSGTIVRADPTGQPSANDLRFSSLATVNFRLFADLGAQPKIVADTPWLRGVRVRLAVDNLFDARPRVHDASGLTPAGYQPDLLDPLGRTISINLRKQFR